MKVIEYWEFVEGRHTSAPFTTEAAALAAATGRGGVRRKTLALYESKAEYAEVNSPEFKKKQLEILTPQQKQALGLDQ